MQSAEELTKKLIQSERENDAKYTKLLILKYEIEEIQGCFDEYKAMSCTSLLERLQQAIIKTTHIIESMDLERKVCNE